MERFSFLNVLKEVAGILNETRKLFLKNKKLMFSVLIFPFLLNGLVYLFNTLTMKPEITTRIFEDFRQFFFFPYIFLAVCSIINLLSVLVIVHASALIHKGDDNIDIKDFPVFTLKSWKGPFVTNFYTILFGFSYMFLFTLIFSPLVFFSTKHVYTVALVIVFVVYQLYIMVVWDLSMVVSILEEETYGIQALRKGAKIVNGMKLKLFLVNIFFFLLSFGLSQIVGLLDMRSSFAVTLTVGFVNMSSIFALRMFQLATYTIAYFQYISFQGKDVESLMDVEYTKITSNKLMGT
ncbi:unnamed protein product [Cochlearia groenlandica]